MITEDARALLATGTVCDSCLGRPFAERSFGLTNAERGRALSHDGRAGRRRGLRSNRPGGLLGLRRLLRDVRRHRRRDRRRPRGVRVRHLPGRQPHPTAAEENERLLREDADLEPDVGESMKREINREVGRRVGAKTETEVDFDRPDVLAIVDLEGFDPRETLESGGPSRATPSMSRSIPRSSTAATRKLERDIPQTEWPCRECGGSGIQLGDDGEEPCDYCGGSGYLYDTSVEQVVRPHVVDAMDGDEGTFHGAGREDVDARMLEGGRPFVLEVKRPACATPIPRRSRPRSTRPPRAPSRSRASGWRLMRWSSARQGTRREQALPGRRRVRGADRRGRLRHGARRTRGDDRRPVHAGRESTTGGRG